MVFHMKSMLTVSLCLLVVYITTVDAFFGRSLNGLKNSQGVLNTLLDLQDVEEGIMNALSDSAPSKTTTVSPQYFPQILDHDDLNSDKRWKQKFYLDDQFWCGNGCPVFFMIGGEGPLSDRYVTKFFYTKWAQDHGALIVALEHRFYGESIPTGNLSNESMKLLSSKQALGDIATFQKHITKKVEAGDSKWVAFGGSYPGNLSAWVRLKLPHLFHASVSSSAPVVAEVNFYQYLETVTEGLLRYGGDECVEVFASATAVIEKLIYNKDYDTLEKTFGLCDPIQNEHDVGVFVSSVTDTVMGITQYNNEGSEKTLTWLCEHLHKATKVDKKTPIEAVKEFIMEDGCIESSYESQVEQWGESNSMRSWIWQTCSEFGYYQSTDSPNEHVFPRAYPIEESIKFCNDVFGLQLTIESLQDRIDATNQYYGGISVANTDRIYFVNGVVDPWHTLGVNKSVNPKSPVSTGVWAHCADMRFPSQIYPSVELDETRERIGAWLNDVIVQDQREPIIM